MPPTLSASGDGRRDMFFWFCASRLFSVLADQIMLFAIPVHVYLISQSVFLSGLTLLVQWLPRVVALPFLGPVVDRFRMRPQLVIVDILRLALLTLALTTGSIPLLIACLGALSLCGGYAYLVLETTVARLYSDGVFGQAQSRLQLIDQVSKTFGPAIGGALLPLTGLAWVIAGTAGLVAASVLILLRRFSPVEAPAPGGTDMRRVLSGLSSGAGCLMRSQALRDLIVLAMAFNFVTGVAIALAPAMLITGFGAADSTVGMVMGLAALTSILVLSALPRIFANWPPERVGRASVAAFLAAGCGLVLAPGAFPFALAYAGLHGAGAAYAVVMRAERLTHIPTHQVGQVLGLFVALVLISFPLSGLFIMLSAGQLAPARILICVVGLAALLSLRPVSRLFGPGSRAAA